MFIQEFTMLRLGLIVSCLLIILSTEGRYKPLITGTIQDVAVTKWLTARLYECPNRNVPKIESEPGRGKMKTADVKQPGNESVLHVLQRSMLTIKIHQFITTDICDNIEMKQITAVIEALHQKILASSYLKVLGDTEATGYFGEVPATMEKLESKIDLVRDYVDTSTILASIQTTRQHLQTLQIAQDLGLIQELELDDILDEIKDFLDSMDDLIDKICDYLEQVKDTIWDWIEDMPIEDLENLFEFLHFWIQNVEIPCDGSGTIIICDVEYHFFDLIQCCIMG